jgi:anion-transporting  ArsA/GET3 family ATPase
MPEASAAALSQLIGNKRVIVCCGAGGVGKTTTSAALGLAGARAGRRVLVLTIDPAKRLAQAMGIKENSRAPIPLSPVQLSQAGITTGSLDAWMLNPDVVFEGLVHRMAPSPEQAERILKSRLFRHLSELVAGMQEYTAAEALYSFAESRRYDLLVLDTPPSRHALDFLEAPGRLSKFLDERVLNMFLPGKGRNLFFKKATELVGNVFTKVFGAEFFAEIQDFLAAFAGMFGPMRAHAEGVRALLSSKDAAFLLVTSPDQAALEEAQYFRQRINAMGLPFAGFVLNRSWARSDGFGSPDSLVLADDACAPTRSALDKLKALANVERGRIDRDRALFTSLTTDLPHSAVAIAAPYLGEAIEDVKGLTSLAMGLTEAPAVG